VFMYIDHKDNIFTGALCANKLISKKFLCWSLDIGELDSLLIRVWLKGETTSSGDAPSRNPEDREAIKQLRVPGGPLKRGIEAMIAVPDAADEEANNGPIPERV